MAKTVFERKEQKYRLTYQQYSSLLEVLRNHIAKDRTGKQTISSIYYDTEDYALIRESIEKPFYKEKLRLRSYGRIEAGETVFLELKKKCDGIVYKRRESLSTKQAADFLAGNSIQKDSQILREISFLLERKALSPKVCLSYERVAYYALEDTELRLTFDRDIRFRELELDLEHGDWGHGLLPQGEMLMEIKSSDALPLWLTGALSELKIYPSSFSKYGYCYKTYIYPCLPERWEVAHSA